jgi:hypothetical protein
MCQKQDSRSHLPTPPWAISAMPSLQLSITLDQQLVAFLDQQGSNRSAAVAEAVLRWRDEQWLEQLNPAYAEEASPGAAL